MAKNKEGKPALTKEQLDGIVQKLEPYLKAGLSIRKACLEAQVPKSSVYEYIRMNTEFADKIEQHRQFLSILLANSMIKELHSIINKQKEGTLLTQDDKNFLKWFAVNSKVTREEFGERKDIGIYDAEAEIARISSIIDAATEKNEDPK